MKVSTPRRFGRRAAGPWALVVGCIVPLWGSAACTLLDFDALTIGLSADAGVLPDVCENDGYDHDDDPTTPCVPPIPCEDNTYDHDYNPSNACVPYTDCRAGQYVGAPPTARVDRQCLACVTGTYTDTVNAEACIFWDRCEPGEQVKQAGSLTADRQCEPCPSGTFSRDLDTAECTPHKTCPVGQSEAVPPSPTSDRICSSCGAGQYSDDGTCRMISECTSGQFESAAPTGVSDRECTDVSDCEAGTFVIAPATDTSDRQCKACSAGTYSSAANVAECTAWSTCGFDAFVSTQPSESRDRECTVCPSDTISTAPNSEMCVAPVHFKLQANRNGLWITVINGFLEAAGGDTVAGATFEKVIDADTFSADGTDVFKMRHVDGMFVGRETPNPGGLDWLAVNKTQAEAEIFDLVDCHSTTPGTHCGADCKSLAALTDDDTQVVKAETDSRGGDRMHLRSANGSCIPDAASWERFSIVEVE